MKFFTVLESNQTIKFFHCFRIQAMNFELICMLNVAKKVNIVPDKEKQTPHLR